MTPEELQKIWPVLESALELDPASRSAFVERACAGDERLHREVLSLLQYQPQGEHFLEEPPFEILRQHMAPDGPLPDLGPRQLPEESDDPLHGRRIGNYEIRERLGEGGMGAVYRAVRVSDFQKQVAIKVVKRGMDTDVMLRRFRDERQILAALDHPNIARLADGGAIQDGRPYLVMDYVEGTPVTQYCEQHQLKLADRLHLFRVICSAVQYAHQNLVIHRDLKPGNILVTPDGTPKLLDFGIAKLMEPDAEVTRTSFRFMTPECASPEQVRGDAVTTATDVYALGVLLYQLLTGEKPYEFRTGTAEEIRRIICETEPRKPSSVRALSEDLNNIVLKAMHKDPSHRYASVEHLSEDIRRYLAARPVTARKDTFRYRASRFLARHKTSSAAAALVACSLIAGMGATLAEMRVARIERARAERRFNDVRQLANSLIFELHDGVRKLPGSTSLRQLIVDRAVTYLDRLAQEVGNDNGLRRELANAYIRLGQVQGERGNSNLGSTQAASVSFRKAVKFYEEIVDSGQAGVRDRRALAHAYDKLSAALWDSGDRKEAQSLDLRALRIRQHLVSRLPPVELDRELGASYVWMGLHRVLTDPQAAEESYRKAVDTYERVLRAEPDSSVNMYNLSLAEKYLGGSLIEQHRYPEALGYFRAAQAIDEKRIAADPNNAEARMDITFTYSGIGEILRKQGDLGGALASYRKVEGIRSAMVAADPKDERAQRGLSSTYHNIGLILRLLHRTEQATANFEKARQIQESFLALDPASSPAKSFLATTCAYLGAAYAELARSARQPDARLALWRKALPNYQRAAQMIAELKAKGTLTGDAVQASQQVDRELPRSLAAIAELTSPRQAK